MKSLTERVHNTGVACFCDAQKTLRVVDNNIRLLSRKARFIGRAFLATARGDLLSVMKAIHDAPANSVVVVSTDGDRFAAGGEFFALEARRRGLAALVVDGYFRDADTVSELDFPVYARGFTPMAGSFDKLFEKPASVSFGGVNITEGDIVFADHDGIIVMSEAEFEANIEKATGIQDAEKRAMAKVRQGKSLFEITNYGEHVESVQENNSEFMFTA